MPVKIDRPISTSGGPPTIIYGTIGGLKFGGTPGRPAIINGNSEIVFNNTAGGTGGFDALTIGQTNGGPEFLEQLQGKLLHDPYFTGPFNVLKAQMANTDEGFLARLKEGWEKKHPGATINGKILQNQWNATLEFKQNEALNELLTRMSGSTLDQLPATYTAVIEKQHIALEELSRYIASLPSDAIADNFEDLLGGTVPGTGARGNVASLEYVSYGTPEYRDLFKEFKEKIQNPRYNYEGLNRSDVGGEAYYDIYNVVLNAFSWITREKQSKVPWDPVADKAEVRAMITKITNRLETTQNANGGVIRKKDLPGGGSLETRYLEQWGI